MAYVKHKRHSWTKDELKVIIEIWESKRIIEIAEQLGVSYSSINQLASDMRKAGIPLTKKTTKGILAGLIKQIAEEYKK